LLNTRFTENNSLVPALTLLFIIILVPTISVLWFMTKAVENERLAVRQTLSEVLELTLADTRQAIDEHWDQTFAAISNILTTTEGLGAFETIVTSGLADSVVLYNAADEVVYPNVPKYQAVAQLDESGAWLAAERAEYVDRDPVLAAELYAAIAHDSSDMNLVARARMAEIRCRVQAGQTKSAIALITETLQDRRLQSATATDGRLIVPNAQMLALSIIDDRLHPKFKALVNSLQARLSNYDDDSMTSTQRQFLMIKLRELAPSVATFPTLDAENLATLYVETEVSPAPVSVLRKTALPDVWHIASTNGKFVALFRDERIIREINSIIGNQSIPGGSVIEVLPPGIESTSPVFGIATSRYLPDWRLSYRFDNSSILFSAADGRIASYLWTGALVIAAALCLTAILAHYVSRQLRHAQLKNDLAATISHELKTPLSSMRVLVDTLLNNKQMDAETSREYLQIISRENARLSHLIDNFLNYSRMSKNGQAFTLTTVNPSVLANSASAAVAEKFEKAGFNLEMDVQSDLSTIEADEDALITALINLLDNARKYSNTNKQVKFRVYQNDSRVCFDVIDHGVGLTKKEKTKVFAKFYRVDHRLSSSASGVGLGLSIVKFIVDAHGGSINVESQSGKGSTFSISMPISETEKFGGESSDHV